MKEPIFEKDKLYRRSLIHDIYGGNRQSGISVSAQSPYIFIFSGKSGNQHGYKDRWENENVFSYTGEGQIGDMNFTKGNLALRDHVRNGKKVYLFETPLKGYAKYISELILIEYDFFDGIDRNGEERKAIKFFFSKIDAHLEYVSDLKKFNQIESSSDLQQVRIPNETERKGLVTSRVGQGAYRKSILYRWNFKCAVTNYNKNEILIASHILPWKEATNEQRLDVNNGILLSPTYDALFDRHLISFEDNGKIILSNQISDTNYKIIGISGSERIKNFTIENYNYLEKHREKLFN